MAADAARLRGPKQRKITVVPARLEETQADSFPPCLHDHVSCDFRKNDDDFELWIGMLRASPATAPEPLPNRTEAAARRGTAGFAHGPGRTLNWQPEQTGQRQNPHHESTKTGSAVCLSCLPAFLIQIKAPSDELPACITRPTVAYGGCSP